MANFIKVVQDKSGNNVFPITHEKAVRDSSGVSLDAKLSALESKTYVEAWDGASTPVVANIPAGVVVSYNGTNYTGTLAASASTDGKVYLVKDGTEYDRYASTINLGGTYIWSYLGTTAMSLSGYATKDELYELDKETDDILKDYTYVENVSPNLFDKTTATSGKAVRKDRGDLYTTDEFYASDYITIPDDAESFYMTQQTYKGVIGWACYNSSKVFTHGGDSRKVTFQEGDVYFRVSINNDNLNSAMVVVGESASDLPAEYAPYGDFSGWRRNPISTDDLSDESVTLKKLNSSAVENIALIGQKQNYRSGGYVAAGNECVEYEGWNITDFIPFTGGPVKWRFGSSTAVVSGKVPCLVMFDSDRNYLNYYTANTQNGERDVTISVEGCAYIAASFYHLHNGEKNDTPLVLNGVDWHAKEYIPTTVHIPENDFWKPFPLGKLVQADISASGELQYEGYYAAKRVSMETKMAVPFEGMQVRIRTPRNYPYQVSACISYGNAAGLLATDVKVYPDSIAQVPASAKAVRVLFRSRLASNKSGAANWTELSVATVEEWLASGELVLEYYDKDTRTVQDRNVPAEVRASAVRRVLDTSDNENNGMDLLPVFAHISDLHGDITRYRNFLDYCRFFGVDAAFNTGDAVLMNHPDGMSYVPYFAGESSVPMLFCIGNHESKPTGQATLFEDNMAALVGQQGYLKAANTPADHCYYYKDFADKKIRVIAVNYYEDGVYLGKLGQTQISWFISTLAATPDGYGVIVLLHSPEDRVIADSPLDKFMQPYNGSTGFYVGERPIMQIIDAFIAKGTLSTTYTENGATVTISADFTGVDADTEFIAYVCGHTHRDRVGYYEHSTNRQLCLCVTCGIALFGDSSYSEWANVSDLPRGGRGASQDVFNLYAVDRVGGNVRIVRVGSDITTQFAHRDMMVIPYIAT